MDTALVLSIIALSGTTIQSILQIIGKIKKSSCCGSSCTTRAKTTENDEEKSLSDARGGKSERSEASSLDAEKKINEDKDARGGMSERSEASFLDSYS